MSPSAFIPLSAQSRLRVYGRRARSAGPFAIKFPVVSLLVLAFFSCRQPPPPVYFQQTITDDPKPWTHENFDTEKFTFAIFSDLTGGEREGVFEVAVAQLNLLRPDLILNVGDLIEGDHESLDELNQQWNFFDERAQKAKAPVFYVGGNHDLSGPEMWEAWDQRYGHRYYHFVYKNVLFLVLDTENNSPERMQEIVRIRTQGIEIYQKAGPDAFSKTEYARLPERISGNISKEQSAYFQKVIAEHPDVQWTFLFMHKPAWKKADERNFAAIEAVLADRPYTVFYGHTHIYNYQQRHGRDYINLATTGGIQFPDKGRSMDQVALVTVDEHGVDITNLLMAGILDKTGHVPLGGDSIDFEKSIIKVDE
jgi:predicted phosphodiesterase